MKKHRARTGIILGTVLCAAPYALIPAISSWMIEELLPLLTRLLCIVLPLLEAALLPFFLARRGVPAIAAWPWPLLCALILPLWGMRPALGSMAAGFFMAIVSGVAGEEWKRRGEEQRTGRKRGR